MERIFAPESLKHCLLLPSLHPSLSLFLSFFPFLSCFLPPSFFSFLPSSHLCYWLSLCVLVPSQNNLGKSAQRIGAHDWLAATMEWKCTGANGDLVRRTRWFSFRCCLLEVDAIVCLRVQRCVQMQQEKSLQLHHCFLRRWDSSSALGAGSHGNCGPVVTAVDASARLPGLTSFRTDTSLRPLSKSLVFLYPKWFACLELYQFCWAFKQL